MDSTKKKVLEYIKEHTEFTPLEVAKGCKIGYARAVVTIDGFFQEGLTDQAGWTSPLKPKIKYIGP